VRRIADDLWVVERPLRTLGLELGRRMAVVRLRSGELLLHSPAELDGELRDALDGLGPVRFVVPASLLHGHLYMEQYRAAYPQAELFAAPGLAPRRKDLAFDGLLGDVADPRWAEDLDQAVFLGNRFFEEVVFLHRSSRSLIVGDTFFNLPPDASLRSRLWTYGPRLRRRPGPTVPFRTATRARASARASVRRILQWDFDRIVVGHGEIVETGGRRAFAEGLGWL
jgi:hypothetical protein